MGPETANGGYLLEHFCRLDLENYWENSPFLHGNGVVQQMERIETLRAVKAPAGCTTLEAHLKQLLWLRVSERA